MNISQKTNFSDYADDPTLDVDLSNGERRSVIYHTYNFPETTYKFGYCCENRAIQYPIRLTVNGVPTQFQTDPVGIFEFQREKFTDINSKIKPPEEDDIIIAITEAAIPFKDISVIEEEDPSPQPGFNFKIDYVQFGVNNDE